MSLYVVDVEADGPIPGKYSMTEFGAVQVNDLIFGVPVTFYGQCKPISELWVPEALAVSKKTREEVMQYPDPKTTMENFAKWVAKTNIMGYPTFITDNLAFDWQFINYYFHYFLGQNPFGFSGRRIGDIYAGMLKDMSKANRWKNMREQKHTHNPVDDALGNAQALWKFRDFGLRGL